MSSVSLNLINYTHPDTSIEVEQLASHIDAGTLVSLDFLDPNCYPNGVVPASLAANAIVKDLIGGQTYQVVNSGASPLPITSTGVRFTQGAGDQGIRLNPATAQVPKTCIAFGLGFWMKNKTNLAPATLQSVMAARDPATAKASQWYVERFTETIEGSDPQQGYHLISSGLSMKGTLQLEEVAHFFMHSRISGTTLTVELYKNGALVQTKSDPNYGTQFEYDDVDALAILGRGAPYGHVTNFELGSFDIQRFDVTGARPMRDYLDLAYGDNVGRHV